MGKRSPAGKSKIFVSYARKDTEFVLRLGKDLSDAGVDVWIDQMKLEPGENWDDAIEEALDSCKCLLVVLSPTSVESENVKDEIAFARKKKKRIVPLLYKPCEIPYRIGRLQRCDFAGDYSSGLTQVLHALNVPPGRESTPKVRSGEKEKKKSEILLVLNVMKNLGSKHFCQRAHVGRCEVVYDGQFKTELSLGPPSELLSAGQRVGGLSGLGYGFIESKLTDLGWNDKGYLLLAGVSPKSTKKFDRKFKLGTPLRDIADFLIQTNTILLKKPSEINVSTK